VNNVYEVMQKISEAIQSFPRSNQIAWHKVHTFIYPQNLKQSWSLFELNLRHSSVIMMQYYVVHLIQQVQWSTAFSSSNMLQTPINALMGTALIRDIKRASIK